MRSIASRNAETIFAPAGDNPSGSVGRNWAVRFRPRSLDFLAGDLLIGPPVFLAIETRRSRRNSAPLIIEGNDRFLRLHGYFAREPSRQERNRNNMMQSDCFPKGCQSSSCHEF